LALRQLRVRHLMANGASSSRPAPAPATRRSAIPSRSRTARSSMRAARWHRCKGRSGRTEQSGCGCSPATNGPTAPVVSMRSAAREFGKVRAQAARAQARGSRCAAERTITPSGRERRSTITSRKIRLLRHKVRELRWLPLAKPGFGRTTGRPERISARTVRGIPAANAALCDKGRAGPTGAALTCLALRPRSQFARREPGPYLHRESSAGASNETRAARPL
jgi:hypothetical protein